PLLGPGRARAIEHPCGARVFVVARAADERVFAFFRERDAPAELARTGLFFAGELLTLLGPGRARAKEDPRGADLAVVARAADQRIFAVGGERRAVAEG